MGDVEITDVSDDGFPYETEKVSPKNQDLSSFSQFGGKSTRAHAHGKVEILAQRILHLHADVPSSTGELLSQYGWYLLVLTVLVYLLIQKLSKRRSDQSSPPQTLQDAVLVARRQEAMEAARRRMQEELDAKSAIFKEKQKQREEERRRQKIEIWESMQQGKSYKGSANFSQTTEEASSSTTVLKPKTDKKPLRSGDYSPLTGQGGGSCSWRPGRRGPSSGG